MAGKTSYNTMAHCCTFASANVRRWLVAAVLTVTGTLSASAQITDCLDFTNLRSSQVTCRYGTFYNPDATRGVVDNGSQDASSRHTVHTSLTETDRRTNYRLRTVPPGETASVRLGNWLAGAQAESITYRYTVDTLQKDLLILKYAAVLQDPRHSPTSQPRFTIEIQDSNGQAINPTCYSADFIASSSLGWTRGSDDNYWKDWTTVGIDLSPLHGQTIDIKLTTRDCSASAHYGYAYFVLKCGNKALQSTACGDGTANTFTAPDGFDYEWYREDNPANILSRQQSLFVSTSGTYVCRLIYAAASHSVCSFTMKAVAGPRFPVAAFHQTYIGTAGCDVGYQFYDDSQISTDANGTRLTGTPCEGVLWDFGDGQTSTASNPTHYFTTGTYTVRQIALLAGGRCTDTSYSIIRVTSPCQTYDTLHAVMCDGHPYRFGDSVITRPGRYVITIGLRTTTLFVTTAPNSSLTVYDTACENMLPRLFHGRSYNAATAHDTIVIAGVNSYGCDSIIDYNLHVWRNTYTDSVLNVCVGDFPITCNGITFTTAGAHTDTLSGVHGEDSIVTLTVNMLANSYAARVDTIVENLLPWRYCGTTYRDTVVHDTLTIANHLGCDSIIDYSLHVWRNVYDTVELSFCERLFPLLWNGVEVADEGTVTATLRACHGEDSIITAVIHKTYNTSSIVNDTIVENSLPWHFNGAVFTGPTQGAAVHLTNAVGCDSLIRYSLFVHYNIHRRIDSIVCDLQLPMVWRGLRITYADSTAAGIYSKTLTLPHAGPHGVDSIITLLLFAYPAYDIHYHDTICQGSSRIFASVRLYDAGDYPRRYRTTHGCDSVETLHLRLHPIYTDIADTQELCYGETFSVEGYSLRQTCDTLMHLHTTKGCDSLVAMHLDVWPVYSSLFFDTICDNRYIMFAGHEIADTGFYSYTLHTIHQCDSTLSLKLYFYHHLQAAIRCEPAYATYAERQIRLYDVSDGAFLRQWLLPMMTDTSQFIIFDYPVEYDSLPVVMYATSRDGCHDTAAMTITLRNTDIWAPTAFTPGEPTNNTFAIYAADLQSLELFVYSRDGLIVAHLETVDGSWDGTYNGKALPQAAYVWQARYTFRHSPSKVHRKTGTVLLIR